MSRPFTHEEAREILAQVRGNLAKLDVCPRHVFEPEQPITPLRQRYRCKVCDGSIDSHAFHWYERGLRDGKV